MTIGDKATLDKSCQGGACPSGTQAQIDTMNRNGLVSDLGFGLGVAGLAVGIVSLFVSAPGRDTVSSTGSRATLVVRPDGVSVLGTF